MQQSHTKQPENFRDVMLTHLRARVERNPQYTQGAFARDIAVPSHRLSEILSGKQGLSRGAAEAIAQRLSLSTDEKRYFCDLVDSKHARSKAVRLAATARLFERKQKSTRSELETMKPVLLTNWYHLAIVEVIRLTGIIFEPQWYAKKLGISVAAAKTALKDLTGHAVVNVDAQTGKALTHNFESKPDVPSLDAKRFHAEAMKLATKALYETDVHKREFSSFMIPVRKEKINEYRERLRTFLNRLADDADADSGSDSVYMLSAQLFPILTVSESPF